MRSLAKTVIKKYIVKIPQKVSVFYSENRKLITFVGPSGVRSLKLTTKLILDSKNRCLYVSSIPFTSVSNKIRSLLPSIQGLTASSIRHFLTETFTIFPIKMRFVGVGYRAFYVENYLNSLILLKLGYSHLIYVRIPSNIRTGCLKFTRLFLFGAVFDDVKRFACLIRSCRPPEPYKGKGILYVNEKIKLKEGKKA